MAVRRERDQARYLTLARDVIGVVVFVVMMLGFWRSFDRINDEAEHRCEAFIHGYELLGEELGAPQDRINAFIARLETETDC